MQNVYLMGNVYYSILTMNYIIYNNGPNILPNAAKDCENPLILPKYFFT